MTMKRVWLMLAMVVLSGCVDGGRGLPTPAAPGNQVLVGGIAQEAVYQKSFDSHSLYAMRAHLAPGMQSGALPVNWQSGASCDLLAISAGGDRGAFAAGVLTGWTKAGDRPTFRVVTGVSVGALIAPFAFLGPRYDHVLREFALSVTPDRIFRRRSVIAGLFSDGLSSSEPLEAALETYVTDGLLRDIAAEYLRGRDLFIMTVDLDDGRPVVWNMGAIAASRSPGSLRLFRQVMRASTAIPVVVSPELIDLTVGAQHFQEMHVDGSVAHQLFLPPLSTAGAAMSSSRQATTCHAFAIINRQVEMERSSTPRHIVDIGERSMEAFMQVQTDDDIENIAAVLAARGIDLSLARIDDDFSTSHPLEFDSSYVRALFDYGEEKGSSGKLWRDAPSPGAPSRDAVPVYQTPSLQTQLASAE
jgi:predicted acylesterase/phospholipase RssA